MTTLRGIWIGNAVEPGVPLISDGHMGFYRDAALDKKLCARMDLMRRKGQLEPIPFAKAERLFRPRKHRNPRYYLATLEVDPEKPELTMALAPGIRAAMQTPYVELMRSLLGFTHVRVCGVREMVRLYRGSRLVGGIMPFAF